MKHTKEEILEKHYRNYKKRIAFEDHVLKAMDEYAKQESAELLEALKNCQLGIEKMIGWERVDKQAKEAIKKATS